MENTGRKKTNLKKRPKDSNYSYENYEHRHGTKAAHQVGVAAISLQTFVASAYTTRTIRAISFAHPIRILWVFSCGGDFPRLGVKNLVKCPKSGKYEPKNKRTGRNGLSAINLEVDAVVPYYLSMYSLYSYAYKLEVRVSLSIRTPPTWRCAFLRRRTALCNASIVSGGL